MRRQIAVYLLLCFLIVAVLTPVSASPLFPDVPEQHWARDAVADLAAKGIIEGYPDGTFKGDRAATRWEMALMLQRTLAKMSAEHAKFATKTDLEALRALVNQLKDELDALGIRVRNLEENVSSLDKRTTELERIRFYGYIQTMMVGIDVRGSLNNAGTRNVPVVDWTNGRVLQNGSGFTALGKFGTIVRATKDSSFGLEVAGFSSLGDQAIDAYWGVSAPYLSNPYTAKGAANPGLQPMNNTPWNRVALDRFWWRYKPLNLLLTVGSFNPEKVEKSVLYGQRNPNINSPEILPFYGINVKGDMGRNSKYSYEVLYSRLAGSTAYESFTTAGTIMYKFDKGEVKVHYMHAGNGEWGDGTNLGAGGTVLPAYPAAPGNAAVYWKNRAGVITNPNIGPQDMNVFGINMDYRFNEHWKAFVKFASSSYDPDTTGNLYNETAQGTLFNLGVKAEYEKVRGQLEYLSVENDYDPFILQYPGAGQGIPVFLPYSTYYFNYYQLHDYINLPSNRQGFRVSVEYDFDKKTTGHVNYGYLEQQKASTLDTMTTVGNIEPLFSYLQGGGSQKGKVQDLGLWVKHDFGKLSGKLGYNNYQQRRSAPRIDDVDLKEDLIYLNLGYAVSKKFDLFANYYHLDYDGHNGYQDIGFTQSIPSISGVYRLTDDTSSLGVTYRFIDFNNKKVDNADWHAGQLMMEYNLKF